MSGTFRMYGSDVSYFTAKARAALRAKRVCFEELLATPTAYRDVLLPRTGLAFLPTIVTPEDDTWQDTSDILDALERRFPEPALFPPTPCQRVAAYVWELYADEFLLLPALHYRWADEESASKARADFAASSGDAESAARFADLVQRVACPGLGVTERTGPAIEAHTHELLELLERHFERHGFLLGERPSLADCALMGPLYAHLYNDARPARLLREKAPRTCHWIQRMNHPDVPSFGPWLPADALGETMRPLLELIGRDAAPYVLDGARGFEAWADAQGEKGAEPPRIAGEVESSLRGVSFRRAVSSYTLWMLQRSVDAYAALAAEQRARVDEAIDGTGCEAVLRYRPRFRLGKRRFRLVLEG